jgi:hypothetical protein
LGLACVQATLEFEKDRVRAKGILRKLRPCGTDCRAHGTALISDQRLAHDVYGSAERPLRILPWDPEYCLWSSLVVRRSF